MATRQISLAIDPVTGDFETGTGGLRLTDDLAQAIASRLRLWAGEWFLDETVGFPWPTVLGPRRGRNIGHIRAAFRAEILGTPGVVKLTTLDVRVDKRTRKLTVAFRANGEPARTITLP